MRGKDAAENEKLFVKITDKIKESGVSLNWISGGRRLADGFV